MRHLVDRQGLLAAAIAGEDPPHAVLRVPEVEQDQPVLAEKAGDVMAPVARHQAVVGLGADFLEAFHLRARRIAHVGDPDLAGVIEAEDEAPARRIHQAHDFRTFGRRWAFCRDIGYEFQRLTVEDLDPARLVVGYGDQLAIL